MTPEEQRDQRIRDRAFVISQEPGAGSAEDNWLRAEHEIAAEDEAALRVEAVDRAHEVAVRTALTHP